MVPEKGCSDVNECHSSESICGIEQYCVNTEGSYSCLNCDQTCLSCTGEGPNRCKECAEGYVKRDNICIGR